MHYYLIDINPKMVSAWSKYFGSEENVTIKQSDITHQKVDAIVSPANSFGFMDGGVDYAISERLGWDLQERLQSKIKELPEGELLTGRSMILETGDSSIHYLISFPTMRVPMNFNIKTSINAYLAMKATLISGSNHGSIQSMAIPGFCTGVGRMDEDIAALQMYRAFEEIVKGKRMDFSEFQQAQKYHWNLNQTGMLYD